MDKMKMIRNTTALLFAVTVFFGMEVFSQEKNELLNRGFWKSQPSLDAIQEKLDAGHSATAMTAFNFDATGYAILENNSLETIKFLLDQGNDVNKLTHDARTYIFWAAYKGNVQLMKYLVSKGARTDLIDQHGYTLMMFAASTGQENMEVYEYCLELGSDMLKERTRDGRNALLAFAGKMTHIEQLGYFIEKGLDIHSKDPDGNGVFHHAAKTGNEAVMRQLISAFDVDYSVNKNTNENALLFASRRFSRTGLENSLSFYQYLEQLGLDPAIISTKGNSALINLARNAKNEAVFRYFIEKGANPNQMDDKHNNALIYAAKGNKMEIVRLLADHTDDVNKPNKEGHTALTNAIKYNDLKIAQFLINEGAKLMVTDQNGYDLGYHLIDAFRGDIDDFNERFRFLTDRGYDPLILQKDGTSLIHLAAKKNNLDLLKLLLSKGIDINHQDNHGQTVLHIAAMQSGNNEILKYLLGKGADKSVLTPFDESAYDLALQNEMLAGNSIDVEFLK